MASRTEPVLPAAELARALLATLLAERPGEHDRRMAVILNGLGGTKYKVLSVLWHHLTGLMRNAGSTVMARGS